MTIKLDSNAGLAEDQSRPIEKIQNGDHRKGANRDQRSHAREAGGPGGSLQRGITGQPDGQVPPHEGLVHKRDMSVGPRQGAVRDGSGGVAAKDRIMEAGALDRSGHAGYQSGEGSLDSTIASNSKGEPSDTVTTGGATTDLKTGLTSGDAAKDTPAVPDPKADAAREQHKERVAERLDKNDVQSVKVPIGGDHAKLGENVGEGKGASGEAGDGVTSASSKDTPPPPSPAETPANSYVTS